MSDTIAAIATPPGRGGVGVIRVSGSMCSEICLAILGFIPPVRHASYAPFLNHDTSKIDEGIAIFFKGPHSFTGEDVLELQGHGGPIVLDMMLRRIISLGARLARAGEFSERAFLNNKMDLVQAEAVAQLISASTEQAAVAAMRSLQGEFSKTISQLVEKLIQLRLYVEAAIDFPEEEISFLADARVLDSVQQITSDLSQIMYRAKQGALLADGVDVVIVGRPNAGKSTLLNKLTGQDTAIVTPIAGTTRDLVRAQINLDGLLLNVVDTAGLRETDDLVELEGIKRAWQALDTAALVMLVIDGAQERETNPHVLYPDLMSRLNAGTKILVIYNKIDKINLLPQIVDADKYQIVYLSADQGAGLDLLQTTLKRMVGYETVAADQSIILARRRHLDALARAEQHLQIGWQCLELHAASELLAEELRHAQLALSEITGAFSSDDLLGRIFSEFCIGK